MTTATAQAAPISLSSNTEEIEKQFEDGISRHLKLLHSMLSLSGTLSNPCASKIYQLLEADDQYVMDKKPYTF